jgi:hypothetical protein
MAVKDTRAASVIKDARFRVPQLGTVSDRIDPRGLNRVRVTVPGLHEPASVWAFPLSIGGGAKDYGISAVPPVGADVVLFYMGGREDRPFYLAANWGAPGGVSELPQEAQDSYPDAVVIATPGSRIVIDETEGARKILITMLSSGDGIIIDEATATMTIKSTGIMQIQCDGQIEIDALSVAIKGRAVRPIDEPI